MAFCKKCGRENNDTAAFCASCGTSATDSSKKQHVEIQKAPVTEKKQNATKESGQPVKTQIRNKPAYGGITLEHLPKGYLIDNRYEVLSKLGQGGFGAVYLVYDNEKEVRKALKVMPEAVACDREAMDSLKQEAMTMGRLKHPNIVKLYGFNVKGPVKYIAMEYVEGKNLSELKVAYPEGKIPEDTVKKIALQIAKILSYAHLEKVIHRDIKPQNILISKAGKVKLMDFGISETIRTSMSRVENSSSAGTIVYMSPEQIVGKNVGREADVYSFGVMLYELLNGKPPFHSGDISWQIVNEKPTRIKNISTGFNDFLQQCLEKDYLRRLRNFDEVLKALSGKMESREEVRKKENVKIGKQVYVPENTTQKKVIVAAVVALLFLFIYLIMKPEKIEVSYTGQTFTNSLGMEFVYIEPGSFIMGSDDDRKSEAPAHEVALAKGFYLQTTEVTNAQWRAVINKGKTYRKARCNDCPVGSTTWNKVKTFIAKLNEIEGVNRYRLPTEAEWEYACRADSTTDFNVGDCLSTEDANFDGTYRENTGCPKINSGYGKSLVSVKSYSPNDWGLYGMHGNASEWCEDWYEDYPAEMYVVDPKGSLTGTKKVIRGGSVGNSSNSCRSSSRSSFDPVDDEGYSDIGFRVICNVEDAM